MKEDTIAAIATANAMGAVSMIRISGPESLTAVSHLTGKDLTEAKGYTIHYGLIHDGEEAVDQVLINVYRAPAFLYRRRQRRDMLPWRFIYHKKSSVAGTRRSRHPDGRTR
jgi:hypothetical protein